MPSRRVELSNRTVFITTYSIYTGLAYDLFFYILFALGNFVLVFEEYYITDGYCTTLRKCYSSLKRMMFDISVGVVAGIVIVGEPHIHTYIYIN